MNNIFQNVLAIMGGLVLGSLVNMGIIIISGNVIPPPEGVDVTSMESLAETIHLFEPKHFIMPFLAHALGTLAGAMLAVRVAATNGRSYALVIGFVFLAGGIYNVMILPAPMWFNVLDLVVAYIPMAWIATKLIKSRTVTTQSKVLDQK